MRRVAGVVLVLVAGMAVAEQPASDTAPALSAATAAPASATPVAEAEAESWVDLLLSMDLDTADKLSSVASGAIAVGGLFGGWIFYRRRRSNAALAPDISSEAAAASSHTSSNTTVTQQDTSGFAAAGNQVISGTIHQSNTINQHSPVLLEHNRQLLEKLEQKFQEVRELESLHSLTTGQLQMLTTVVLGRSTSLEQQAADLIEVTQVFMRLKQEAGHKVDGGAPEVDALLQQAIELFGQGKVEQSQDQLAQALQKARTSALPQKRQIAHVLVTQARQQLVLLNREAGAALLIEAFNEVQHWADLEVCSWLEEAGRALQTAGNTKAALAAYQQLLDTMQAKTPQQQSDDWLRALAISHNRIGDIRKAQGHLDAALDAYQKDLEIAERLANQDPANTDWQRDLSVSHNKIGDIRQAQGQLDVALDAYSSALKIRQQLANQDPDNTQWQRDLFVSNIKIGMITEAQGQLDAALDAYSSALKISQQLTNQDPANTDWQRDLSVSHERTGDIRLAQGQLDAALDAYSSALKIRQQLANRDPANTEWQRDLSVSHERIGDIRKAQGQLDAALDAYQKGLEIAERLANRDPARLCTKSIAAYRAVRSPVKPWLGR